MKKIFTLILVLLILCACNVHTERENSDSQIESETSVSESSESESEISSEAESENLTDVNPLLYENLAKEIYESEDNSTYLSCINKLIETYRSGTFVEMENHHPPYPKDFPDAKNLPDATEENVFLCWKNEKPLNESSYIDGCIEYLYVIDENHAIILEPAKFEMEGEISFGFANTGYLNSSVEERLSEFYDGYFGGNA